MMQPVSEHQAAWQSRCSDVEVHRSHVCAEQIDAFDGIEAIQTMSLRTPANVTMRGKALLREWFSDEHGQDLIEYMLLATFVALVTWVGVQAIGINMNTTYRSWDETTQDIWEVPDPVPAP
jgi:Flp pilus assembly pilin Flp